MVGMGVKRLADRPTWLLARAQARGHAAVSAAMERHGVRGYHFRVLAALDELGPTSQAEVGRLAELDRSDVTATVIELEAAGHVVRGADDADRRRVAISITPAGRRLLSKLDDALDQAQAELLAPLTATERASLVDLLHKLV